jgi:glycine cleavage system pyridoxal-binding protein P
MVEEAFILVTAVSHGNHRDLVRALADKEDTKNVRYKIKGIERVYEAKCKDHDAVVAVSAENHDGIIEIENVIKGLKGSGLLVSDTHVIPAVIKARGDP